MNNETNLKSAYDSLQKKELEQRKTIKQMSERIKELEALVPKNESFHLVGVSDSEIEIYAKNTSQNYTDDEGEQIDISDNLQEGAKWMRDKLIPHSH